MPEVIQAMQQSQAGPNRARGQTGPAALLELPQALNKTKYTKKIYVYICVYIYIYIYIYTHDIYIYIYIIYIYICIFIFTYNI